MKSIALTNSPLFTLVDDSDFDFLSQYAWRIDSNGYAVTGNPKTNGLFFIHELLLETPVGCVIDHKDRQPLNNQRENLRFATRAQNVANSKIRSDNKSKFKGVSFYKRNGKWRAQITANGKKLFLGYYDTAEQSSIAYKQAAKFHFGEFANV